MASFVGAFLLVFLHLTLQLSIETYAGALALLVSIFFLVFAPIIRLSRLGDYLRENGLDNLAARPQFGTRDDHFLLDYSIGRWFQHASFFVGYMTLVTVYFVSWFIVGPVFLLPSIPMLAILFLLSRTSAKRLLAPYDPRVIASKIELVYPPRPIWSISPRSYLVMTFFYLLTSWSLTQNLSLLLLLAVPYFVLVAYLLVLRQRSRKEGDGK